jgi:hypothetical protein
MEISSQEISRLMGGVILPQEEHQLSQKLQTQIQLKFKMIMMRTKIFKKCLRKMKKNRKIKKLKKLKIKSFLKQLI